MESLCTAISLTSLVFFFFQEHPHSAPFLHCYWFLQHSAFTHFSFHFTRNFPNSALHLISSNSEILSDFFEINLTLLYFQLNFLITFLTRRCFYLSERFSLLCTAFFICSKLLSLCSSLFSFLSKFPCSALLSLKFSQMCSNSTLLF